MVSAGHLDEAVSQVGSMACDEVQRVEAAFKIGGDVLHELDTCPVGFTVPVVDSWFDLVGDRDQNCRHLSGDGGGGGAKSKDTHLVPPVAERRTRGHGVGRRARCPFGTSPKASGGG